MPPILLLAPPSFWTMRRLWTLKIQSMNTYNDRSKATVSTAMQEGKEVLIIQIYQKNIQVDICLSTWAVQKSRFDSNAVCNI